jgi:hypothetical protein
VALRTPTGRAGDAREIVSIPSHGPAAPARLFVDQALDNRHLFNGVHLVSPFFPHLALAALRARARRWAFVSLAIRRIPISDAVGDFFIPMNVSMPALACVGKGP